MSVQTVCIIGHRGYIGSFLTQELQKDARIQLCDKPSLSTANVVIYLGGLVGSIQCNPKTEREVFDANVGDIMNTAANMQPGALLLYASTAALYEGHGMSAPKESSLLHDQLFDKYTRSMHIREANLKTLTHIHTIGLRLGTTTGISPNQKKTSIYIKMLRDAVLHGKIRVSGAHMGRSILWMQDLLQVVQKIIAKFDVSPASFPKHRVYNVCSFNSTVAKIANELGCKTGSNVLFEEDTDLQKRMLGFSMDSASLQTDFDIQWRGSNSVIVDELLANLKHVCKSDSHLQPVTDGALCRVCKQTEQMAVLYDFGEQPNANHYLETTDPHAKLPTYPLRLDLCKNCYHTQLSYTIPPEEVFSNYIYLSGTTNTMRNFFRDFAEKSVNQCANPSQGTVLEIACNDGSLLDWYKTLGWKTYGYDPAQNIHAISSAKGHDVTVGFWGVDPIPSHYPSFDLIVAQNVCAHVPDPVAFLSACRQVMQDNTILYIQTSQSEMIERGQYDTAYHEHLSFFTVRSMDMAAKRAGLVLDDVEKVDVHGTSYVFRLRLSSTTDITQHPLYMYEKNIGLYDDLLYYVYVEKVNELGKWLHEIQRREFANIPMVGYGAAAKGMTVLNSLHRPLPLDYIVDDSKFKQGFLATNHRYPIVPPKRLAQEKDYRRGPIAILVLAWNFLAEIKERVKALRPFQPTYFIVTYPLKTIWYVCPQGKEYKVFEEIDTRYVPEKSVANTTMLFTHFYNEEALLTQWIRHHAPLFNCAVLIDYHSTDNSREIIKREAPDSWNVVYSMNREFGAVNIDAEVSGYENSFNNEHWRLALTTTEFLNTVGLRRQDNPLFSTINREVKALRIPSVTVVQDERTAVNTKCLSLVRQINSFYFQTEETKRNSVLTEEEERYVNNHYNRFMHRIRDFQNPYHVGRHTFKHASHSQNMHILKYVYGPFPELYSRKLQIKTRMPESDKFYNFGHQHLIEFDGLDADYKRKQQLPLIQADNLAQQLEYFDAFMRSVNAQDQTLYGMFRNMFD
jgi:nucleoside-diphosphate-sugar epimerase/SAM-dependent methyltransferase